MTQVWKTKCALALTGILLFGSSIAVCAEEVEPAGYHVYDVQDEEVSDTWYGIARGDYLRAGVSKLTHGNVGYAVCSGTTFAHRSSDRVYVRIYLDKSDTGTGGWGTLNYWTKITNNNSSATVEGGPYKITRDKFYSVKGVHSVTQGGKTETTSTCTNALYFD